jgi:hypothetical protein
MPKKPADRRGGIAGRVNAALQLVLPLFGPPVVARPAPEPRVKRNGSDQPGAEPAPPDQLEPGSRWRETSLGDSSVRYMFRRRPRKSIGFTVDRRGLLVSAPRWVTLAEVDAAVREKQRWIDSKLAEWAAFESRLAMLQTEWRHGGQLRYLGHSLQIVLGANNRTPHLDTTTTPATLHIALDLDADEAQVQRTVERWLKRRADNLLGERLAFFARALGREPRRWQLSSARTLWGSCTHDGVIRLNWRLIHLPPDLIDYVVAHEVAHLAELNHGPRFWEAVSRILPTYRHAKDRLAKMPEHLAL